MSDTKSAGAAKKTTTPKARKAIDLPLQLGVEVRDLVSGLTGITDSRVEMMSGNTQYNVTPKGDGATVPKGRVIDHHMLEVIGAGVHEKVPVALKEAYSIKLGSEIEDRVTGMKGFAVERCTFLNGCVYYHLSPKVKKGENTYPEGVFVEFKRLKVLGVGVSDIAVQSPEPTPEAPKVTPRPRGPGGPSREMGRIAR